jgi:hypothetical protein
MEAAMSKGKAIALGALVIGSFDATFAIVFWLPRGVAPIRIFQSIAAGLLGRAAFSGGLRSAALGVVIHFGISAAIVAVYLLASRWLPILVRQPVLCGAVYGIMVYGFMNYVVIPLSATARGRFLASWVIASIVVHAFLIGVPAALFARTATGD